MKLIQLEHAPEDVKARALWVFNNDGFVYHRNRGPVTFEDVLKNGAYEAEKDCVWLMGYAHVLPKETK